MSMLFSDTLEYTTEFGKVTCFTQKVSNFKKIWDLVITFSPILWVSFFLMLTILANFLGGY
jgi:hypothetical protein